jgi:hypothetical protein
LIRIDWLLASEEIQSGIGEKVLCRALKLK